MSRSEKHVALASFATVIASLSQTNQLPRAQAFFYQVVQETEAAVDIGKYAWKRPKPYLVDTNRLDEMKEKPSPSYPCSHSAGGMVCALLLGELFPAQKEQLLDRGKELGWHPVVLGSHYPTDVLAGRVLAQAIVKKNETEPGLQK